jgi:hypothetical protein
MLPLDEMDMEPPSFSFWNVPAEIRRAGNCTREEPCVKAAREDDKHGPHHHSDHGDEPPAPPDDAMPPGQQLLDIPHMWRRQQQAAWSHAVQVNQMILDSCL